MERPKHLLDNVNIPVWLKTVDPLRLTSAMSFAEPFKPLASKEPLETVPFEKRKVEAERTLCPLTADAAAARGGKVEK
eukprot:s4106_g4.t1